MADQGAAEFPVIYSFDGGPSVDGAALLVEAPRHALFAGERAVIGGILYLGGGLLGVVVSPLLALAIFLALPIFYALTSEGLPAWRGVGRRA